MQREVSMGKIVVIGGGAAGLSAAYMLERAGHDCTVLEKRDFAGGRIYSAEREGFILDLGAQFFFSKYPATFDMMRRLGIYDQLNKFTNPVGILREGKIYSLHLDPRENFRHPLSTLKFLRIFSGRAKRDAASFMFKLIRMRNRLDFDDPVKSIDLDGISLAEYAKSNFSEEFLDYFIQFLASVPTLGMPEEISAAYGMALAWYFLPGLSTTRGGIGLLAEKLAENLSDVRLNTTATRIVMEGKKVRGVEFEGDGNSEFIDADAVVCATLAGEAAGLLPDLLPPMTDILSDIRYSACTQVMYAFPERPLGELYGIATPRREGLCLAGFVENSVKAPGYAPPGKGVIHALTYGEFAREMLQQSDEEVQGRVTADIRKVVPKFPVEPIFCEIFRWPEAVCLTRPGQAAGVQRLASALREYKGLELAGEYFGMGSVEAAIHSGVAAAARITRGR
jgi:oxygen-dependent protoporphyrinogen oxidase